MMRLEKISAFAIIPAMSRQIAQDLEDAFEDAMINGDSAATHQDDISNWNIRERWGASGLGSSADHRRLFLGMRAAAKDKGSDVDMLGSSFLLLILCLLFQNLENWL